MKSLTLTVLPIAVLAIAGFGLLAGCQSTKKTTQASQPSCSCSGYFANQARPDWADKDTITNTTYFSNGVARCTSLKTIDLQDADQSARAALSRMVSSDVKSRFFSEQSKYGNGSNSETVTITTELASELYLTESSIYDRWVDPASCTVYSAVKVDIADVESAIAKRQQQEAKKLINQAFIVTSNGQHQAQLNQEASALLSQLGVTKQTTKSQANVELVNNIVGVDSANNKLVKLRIETKLINIQNGQTIWSRMTTGKGISFKAKKESELTRLAILDAFDKLKVQLQNRLNDKL